MSFPASPTNGQVYDRYKYNTSTEAWLIKSGDGEAKAKVVFNGITMAIASSLNVASMTDLGQGYYRMNFDELMPDANYAICGVVGFELGTTQRNTSIDPVARTTSYLEFQVVYDNSILYDAHDISVVII